MVVRRVLVMVDIQVLVMPIRLFRILFLIGVLVVVLVLARLVVVVLLLFVLLIRLRVFVLLVVQRSSWCTRSDVSKWRYRE
jgi:hypothetical protein